MKSIVTRTRSWVLAGALLSVMGVLDVGATQLDWVVRDPLLGLLLGPSYVKLQPVPSGALPGDAQQRGQWWIFARFQDPASGTIYVVHSGVRSVQDDGHWFDPEQDYGLVAIDDHGKYRAFATADMIEETPELSDIVIAGLYDDAIERLAVALGGRDELQLALLDQFRSFKYPGLSRRMACALQRAGYRLPPNAVIEDRRSKWEKGM